MIKAILFDMDGVLVDSEPLHFESHKRALHFSGLDLILEDYVKYGVSTRSEYFYDKLQKKYNIEINAERTHAKKQEIYIELLTQLRVIEGVPKKLDELSSKYQLYVTSSTRRDFIDKVLLQVQLRSHFSGVFSAHDSKRGKPFPDIYSDALRTIGLASYECIAVEDSQNGIEAAVGAGIRCVAIPNIYTKNQDLSKATVIISSINDLDSPVLEGE
jgi:HAD superfamily hydrolase (TIGR01509 family)